MEDLERLRENLEGNKGYLITVTKLDNDDKLEHFFITNNFPKIDLLKSHLEIKKLLIKNLEEDTEEKNASGFLD